MPECPFCKKKTRDLLKHLVLSHDIENPEQYQTEVSKVERSEQKKRDFGAFVAQLHEQRRRGSISAEQYRESVTKWFKDHEQE